MKNDLRITIIPSRIKWNDIDGNLENIEHQLAPLTPGDLIVLPEMFATGFIVEEALPSPTDSARILGWMRQLAREHAAAVTGSLAACDNNLWYNRLYFITPEGETLHYDKRHLFPLSPEARLFQRGTVLPIFEYQGWRICPQICYDLRFPKWSRNAYRDAQFKYDLLLYVANWPATRAEAWNTLLRARALENQAYVAACNCVGKDPRGSIYHGDCQAIAPNGTLIVQQEDIDTPLQVTLWKTEMEKCRSSFPVALDWDN